MKKLTWLLLLAVLVSSLAGFAWAAQGGGMTLGTMYGIFVKKSGDTMTGNLTVPTLISTGLITTESLKITNTATAAAFDATSFRGTNLLLGTATTDFGILNLVMGAQTGDPSAHISMEAAGGVTLTMDTAGQPFTIDNIGSGSSGLLYLKGGGSSAGTGILRCYDEDDAEYATIYASSGQGYIKTDGSSPGQLNLQADIKGDVRCFGLTDTGDTTDGKHLIVTRMAAEGDNQIDLYVDKDRQPIITSDATSIKTVALLPMSNDGYALGAAATSWADIFLASGGVINFNNGDTTLTHSAGVLTLNNKLAATDLQLTGVGTFVAISGTQNNALTVAVPDQPAGGNVNGVGISLSADDGGSLAAGVSNGGSITLTAGDAKGSTGNGDAGHIYLTTGAAVNSGAPGAIIVNSNQGIYGVATKTLYIGTRTAGTTNADGQDCQLYAGSGGSGGTGNHNGGNLWLIPGYKAGSGTDGAVLPGSNNYFDLGASGTVWKNVYATTFTGSGTSLTGIGKLASDQTWTGINTFEALLTTISTLVATTATINGGSIGGATSINTSGDMTVNNAVINGNLWVKGSATTVESAATKFAVQEINHGPTTVALTIRPSVEAEGLSAIRFYRVFSDTTPTFEVDSQGDVSAKSFSGDGSGLTNVTGTDSTKVLKAGDTMSGVLTVEGIDVPTTKIVAFNMAGGTAPFTVASDTVVTNLNADKLDSYHASYFGALNGNQAWSGINTFEAALTTIATLASTTITAGSITDSGLTQTRITYAGAAGLLSDNAKLIFDGTNMAVGTTAATSILTVGGTIEISAGTGGGLKFADGTIQITAPIPGGLSGNNAWTGLNTFEAMITIGQKLLVRPSADQALGDDGTVEANAAYVRVAGDGGAKVLDNDPAIADGVADGQRLLIQGTSDTNTVQIADACNTALAGGQAFTLGKDDTIELIWDAGDSLWAEISRSDN